VVEAIRKLRAAIGEEQEKEAHKDVMGWLENLQDSGDVTTWLLNRLYQTNLISEEVARLIEAAPADTAATRYNQATQKLEELLGSFGKTSSILGWVMRILGFVQTPLLAATPWGP
jgi:thioredoxin-like negative regulator of GroEL